MLMHQILKKPLISEKNSQLGESENTYAFEVALTADKTEIRQAIEKVFNVKVVGVRTVVCRGQYFRKAARFGAPKTWKKAFVKLKDGDKLPIFEGA